MSKILAFGEVLWDIIEGEKQLGGAPLNFAIHACRLGYPSSIVSSVGIDELGELALEKIEENGVSTHLIQKNNDKPTGRVNVTLKNGEPHYDIVDNMAYDFIEKSCISSESLQEYDTFYFGTLAQRSENAKEALHWVLKNGKFNTIFYDVNLRPNLYNSDLLRESLERCTIVKMNEEEVEIIADLLFNEFESLEETVNKIQQTFENIELVILTMGEKGCAIYSRQKHVKVQSKKIQVVDSIGAGDAFSAGFLTKFLNTRNPEVSANFGNNLGAFVASNNGAIPDYSEYIHSLI